jgi:hypothetical protein
LIFGALAGDKKMNIFQVHATRLYRICNFLLSIEAYPWGSGDLARIDRLEADPADFGADLLGAILCVRPLANLFSKFEADAFIVF